MRQNNLISAKSVAAALLAGSFLGAAGAPAMAEDLAVHAYYKVYLSGVTIGKAGIDATLGAEKYGVKGWGKLSGMTAMFSNSVGTASSKGTFAAGSMMPARYDFDLRDDSEASKVAIRFAADRVVRVKITPAEPERPDRVPLAEAHKKGALDPLSALVVRHAPDADGPTICNRTVPVFEGLQRFDLPLVYKRTEKVKTEDGDYRAVAHVCGARYVPLAGHRPKRWVIRYMMENKDLEVWLTPVGRSGFSVPWRVSIGTTLGPAVLEAQRFSTTGG
ncbi:MAG: DUF3108 domain-containing protein [Hyphomicrobiales bacterium]